MFLDFSTGKLIWNIKCFLFLNKVLFYNSLLDLQCLANFKLLKANATDDLFIHLYSKCQASSPYQVLPF